MCSQIGRVSGFAVPEKRLLMTSKSEKTDVSGKVAVFDLRVDPDIEN